MLTVGCYVFPCTTAAQNPRALQFIAGQSHHDEHKAGILDFLIKGRWAYLVEDRGHIYARALGAPTEAGDTFDICFKAVGISFRWSREARGSSATHQVVGTGIVDALQPCEMQKGQAQGPPSTMGVSLLSIRPWHALHPCRSDVDEQGSKKTSTEAAATGTKAAVAGSKAGKAAGSTAVKAADKASKSAGMRGALVCQCFQLDHFSTL